MYFEEVLPALRNGAKVRRNAWIENMYIYFIDDVLYDQKDRTISCCDYYLNCTDWEIYKEDIDWQYIKNNKCLCRFWNNKDPNYVLGYLARYDDSENIMLFWKEEIYGATGGYQNCCPATKDEIVFYEDRKKQHTK